FHRAIRGRGHKGRRCRDCRGTLVLRVRPSKAAAFGVDCKKAHQCHRCAPARRVLAPPAKIAVPMRLPSLVACLLAVFAAMPALAQSDAIADPREFSEAARKVYAQSLKQ